MADVFRKRQQLPDPLEDSRIRSIQHEPPLQPHGTLAGEMIREVVVTDLKVNADIPPERFVLRPPPGVEFEEHKTDVD